MTDRTPTGQFWDDLRENLKDPEFRREYVAFSQEIAARDAEANTPTGALRERLADALHQADALAQLARQDDRERFADAVLPIVEAALAEQARLAGADIAGRADSYRVAIRQLEARVTSAEAAVQRVRRMAQVWIDIRPAHPTATTDAHTLAWAGEQIIAALDGEEAGQ